MIEKLFILDLISLDIYQNIAKLTRYKIAMQALDWLFIQSQNAEDKARRKQNYKQFCCSKPIKVINP